MPHTETEKPRILLVDDAPGNILMLMEILGPGYQYSAATNGAEAVKAIKAKSLDLILLDIVMPEMDGYTLCQNLHEDESTRNIPIIFVTSSNAPDDEVRGLSLGAVDFITKPLNPPVVRARVRTHLALKNARSKLLEQNAELMEAARLRDDVDCIMRHDIKGPLNTFIAMPDLIRELGPLTPAQDELTRAIETTGYFMLEMINRSLDIYKIERGTYQVHPVEVDLLAILKKTLFELHRLIKTKELLVQILIQGHEPRPDDIFHLFGEELLCHSMISNVLKNAIEASPRGGTITIELQQDQQAILRFHNKGVVPETIRSTFFQKYTSSGKKFGTGMGTYSTKLNVEIQGGTIQLDTDSDPEGTVLVIRLPIKT